MNPRYTGAFLVAFLVCLSALGQNVPKMERKAQDHFYHEEFSQAIDAYNEILEVDSKHRLAKYRLTICSLLTEHRRTVPLNDILIYKKTQGRKDKFYNYWLGRIYFKQGNFQKAIETWERFLKNGKYKSTEITNETKEFIAWAESAAAQYSHPENYEIDQLSEVINTPFTEFSPAYFKDRDELLFLSSKESLVPDSEFIIYHSFRKEGVWSSPTPLESLGVFAASNANIEVVNNGGKLYLYRAHGKKGELLYAEDNGDKEWMTITRVDPGLSANKFESHFWINEKEDRILFAHRNHGKRYDLDIWETKRDPTNGKWSKPDLFSSFIRSDFDEDFPFMTPDEKTIYFSSKGFESLGGYDIYKSEYNEAAGIWSQPVSLKYPANSTDDDIQFKIDEKTNSGYFVSNRIDSYGSYDVFFFHESAKVLLSGVVTDGAGKPADFAQIQFFPTRETGLMVKAMTDAKGEYKVRVGNDDEIKVDIYFHDEVIHKESFTTPHSEGEVIPMVMNFSLGEEKQEAEPEIIEEEDPMFTEVEDIGSKFRVTNRAKLSNIYFDFGSYELKEDNYGRLHGLLKALQDYPNLEIEIGGHTDNVGESEFNLKLSHDRAMAVASFLVSRGILGDRLVPKGYGDTKPLASNDDEKDGRELNRRIEIVVIE